MRNGTWFAVLCVASVGVLAACGDSGSTSTSTTGTTSTTAGTGGSSTTTTTTTTTTTGTGGAGGATTTTTTTTGAGGAGGEGGSGPVLVNGCDEATAEDHSADAKVAIAFGGAVGFKYSPACIKVKAGTTVTFNGDFVSHPLSGGLDGTKDANSPIKETLSGATKDFVLADVGTYGFFCEFHQAGGMKGAVFVK